MNMNTESIMSTTTIGDNDMKEYEETISKNKQVEIEVQMNVDVKESGQLKRKEAEEDDEEEDVDVEDDASEDLDEKDETLYCFCRQKDDGKVKFYFSCVKIF